MLDNAANLNHRIAHRLRTLRDAQKISLEALSTISGVSRSMISLIERAQTSATAVVLEKLAAAFNVPLASLFESPDANASADPVSHRKDQAEWRDPASGYVRRNLSPSSIPQPLQLVEVTFPPGKSVTFESSRDVRILQQIWMLTGEMEISFSDDRHRLSKGECLAMELTSTITFRNPSKKPARYLVAMSRTTPGRKS